MTDKHIGKRGTERIASSRFHRPGPRPGYFNIGLSEIARQQIRSARVFQEALDVFRAEPDVNSSLVADREVNEAYLTYVPGEQYAIYFTDGGEVGLDLRDVQAPFHLKWLDITNSQWSDEEDVSGGDIIGLKAPGEGHWIVVISSVNRK